MHPEPGVRNWMNGYHPEYTQVTQDIFNHASCSNSVKSNTSRTQGCLLGFLMAFLEYLFHSNQHLWYLISHSTPFFLKQVIALPWPTSHHEPNLFFRTPPNNLEISGVKKSSKIPQKLNLYSPTQCVLFSAVSPSSKIFF